MMKNKQAVFWGICFFVLSILLGLALKPIVHFFSSGENVFFRESEITEMEDSQQGEYLFKGWQKKNRQRPLVVILDNTVYGRPQAGLEKADVIVEFPVEGGLTRLAAIISTDNLDLLGPIRSARSYFVDLAKEYRGILIHAGGSTEALQKIAAEQVDHFDEIYGGTQVSGCFWRFPDRERPYNLFTSSDVLRQTAKKLNLPRSPQPPKRIMLTSETEIKGENVKTITVFYAHKDSMANFVYQQERQVFERFTADNEPYLTYAGEHLQVANVIVQIVPYCYTDGDGHLQLIMHGEGQALIFRQGKVVEGVWRKKPDGFTEFVDSHGKTIPLIEGPTWISVVPRGMRIDY